MFYKLDINVLVQYSLVQLSASHCRLLKCCGNSTVEYQSGMCGEWCKLPGSCCTTLHSTTHHSTTHHSTTHHSTTQHSTTHHSTTHHSTTQHSTTLHRTTLHSRSQHSTTVHLLNKKEWALPNSHGGKKPLHTPHRGGGLESTGGCYTTNILIQWYLLVDTLLYWNIFLFFCNGHSTPPPLDSFKVCYTVCYEDFDQYRLFISLQGDYNKARNN